MHYFLYFTFYILSYLTVRFINLYRGSKNYFSSHIELWNVKKIFLLTEVEMQ